MDPVNRPSEQKPFGEGTNQLLSTLLRNFVVFSLPLLLVFEHAVPLSLNLNHNAYSIFPCIHVKCESMAPGTKVHFNFAARA